MRAAQDQASIGRWSMSAFVQHGARYCFPATQGGLSRGVPTGCAVSLPGVNYAGGASIT
jgi:hypothetical protein